MKKVFIIIIVSIVALYYATAQTPQAINYQAVIRDTLGTIIPNQNLQIKISILQDSINGTAVYSETHTVSTNSFGLVNIAIGNGTVVWGDFSEIDWGASNHYSKTEVDITGGNSFAEVGTSQMLAVPYALHSTSLALKDSIGGVWSIKINPFGELIAIPSAPNPINCGDTLIDPRDGKKYPIVQIGQQCWMAKNLDVGIMIDSLTEPTDNGIIEKWCYHDNPENCNIYGGLYWFPEYTNWIPIYGNDTVKGICPDGWHLPSSFEFNVLAGQMGPTNKGGKLKETGFLHWKEPNIGATNESGFNALGGGTHIYFDIPQQSYYSLKEYGYFGTVGWEFAIFAVDYGSGDIHKWNFWESGADALSIRCVKD